MDLGGVNNGVWKHQQLVQLADAPSRAQRLPQIDDILFQSVRPNNMGHFHYLHPLRLPVVASTGYIHVRMKQGDNEFLYQMFFTNHFNNAVKIRCTGSSYPSINDEEFKSINVQLPSLPEQQKIASLLSSVDETLTLCQRKLDLLTLAKKALMQQIFSQKLRFKADDGSDYPAWEEKKLGDITDNYDSLRVPVTQSERTPGDVPYYGANGIQDYVSGFTHEGEFVLLPEDGASDTKHYPAWVIQRKAWVNNHAHVLRGKEDLLDNFFLAYRITTMDISKYLVGGGRAKLNAETLTSLNLVIPSLPEQKKIASCLSSADALITQARAELEQWQDVKKSLLQQLFV